MRVCVCALAACSPLALVRFPSTQVCVFAFDLLLLDGEVLATQPFRCRRAQLRQLVEARADASRLRLACALEISPEQPVDADDAGVAGQPPASVGEEAAQAEGGAAAEVTEEGGSTSERLHRFLLASLAAGCEGLMLKTLEGVYEPGKRADTWLKMKKVQPCCARAGVPSLTRTIALVVLCMGRLTLAPSLRYPQDYVEGMADSLDLVVIGAWYGDGRKTVRVPPSSTYWLVFSCPPTSLLRRHGLHHRRYTCSASLTSPPRVPSHTHAGVVLAVPHGMLECGDGGVPVHVPVHVRLH